jgi:uncharacterized Ntn-hydrolase superfamily protein
MTGKFTALFLIWGLTQLSATFSIVAFDPKTGDLGVAVQSKFFGVGSVVPYAAADVGAIATQALANPRYGPVGLQLLQEGASPEKIKELFAEQDPGIERRQFLIIDKEGNIATHTGQQCLDFAGHKSGKNYAVAGNILASQCVIDAMAQAFEDARSKGEGELAEWLIASLEAGQQAGGDKRGKQSAALLVVRKNGGYASLMDRYVDIRIDDHQTPIQELKRLLGLHRIFYPQKKLPKKENSNKN